MYNKMYIIVSPPRSDKRDARKLAARGMAPVESSIRGRDRSTAQKPGPYALPDFDRHRRHDLATASP
jgi:hypothetical protein